MEQHFSDLYKETMVGGRTRFDDPGIGCSEYTQTLNLFKPSMDFVVLQRISNQILTDSTPSNMLRFTKKPFSHHTGEEKVNCAPG